jgi:hypothetical protein
LTLPTRSASAFPAWAESAAVLRHSRAQQHRTQCRKDDSGEPSSAKPGGILQRRISRSADAMRISCAADALD